MQQQYFDKKFSLNIVKHFLVISDEFTFSKFVIERMQIWPSNSVFQIWPNVYLFWIRLNSEKRIQTNLSKLKRILKQINSLQGPSTSCFAKVLHSGRRWIGPDPTGMDKDLKH